MLKLTRVVGCVKSDNTLSENTTVKHLCVLHFTDCTNSILSGTFAASDYAITAHLDAYGIDAPKDANGVVNFAQWISDVETHLKSVNNGIVNEAYGFTLPVDKFVDGAVMLKMGDVEMSTRRVMGIGANEQTAQIDAIEREKGRLNFAIAKGRCEVVYGE